MNARREAVAWCGAALAGACSGTTLGRIGGRPITCYEGGHYGSTVSQAASLVVVGEQKRDGIAIMSPLLDPERQTCRPKGSQGLSEYCTDV